jgi:uncharacterized protein YhhL (DUF1145 family)
MIGTTSFGISKSSKILEIRGINLVVPFPNTLKYRKSCMSVLTVLEHFTESSVKETYCSIPLFLLLNGEQGKRVLRLAKGRGH